MGHDWDPEFASEEKDGKTLIETTQAAGVRLKDGDGSSLEELFEHDAVVAHFTSGHTDSAIGSVLESPADCSMSEDVIGRGGFFDEPGFELRECFHIQDCFGNGPNLMIETKEI
jgi:hypothetical protein